MNKKKLLLIFIILGIIGLVSVFFIESSRVPEGMSFKEYIELQLYLKEAFKSFNKGETYDRVNLITKMKENKEKIMETIRLANELDAEEYDDEEEFSNYNLDRLNLSKKEIVEALSGTLLIQSNLYLEEDDYMKTEVMLFIKDIMSDLIKIESSKKDEEYIDYGFDDDSNAFINEFSNSFAESMAEGLLELFGESIYEEILEEFMDELTFYEVVDLLNEELNTNYYIEFTDDGFTIK